MSRPRFRDHHLCWANRHALRDDDGQLTAKIREAHELCEEHGDIAGASLLENCIDEAERRMCFLFEGTRATWRSEWIDKLLIDSNSQTQGGSHDQHEKRDR